jgi:hypothetical protein
MKRIILTIHLCTCIIACTLPHLSEASQAQLLPSKIPLPKLPASGTATRSLKEFSFTVHGCFIYLQVNGWA